MSTEERREARAAPKRTRKAKAIANASATATESEQSLKTVNPTINASLSVDTLSPSHERFAQLVADGKKLTDAYRRVYGKDSPNADSIACQIASKPAVKARILALRDEINRQFIGSAVERRKVLWDTIRAKPKDRPGHGDRISAIKLDAQLAGELEPQRDAVTVTLGLVLGSLNSHSIKQAEQVIELQGDSQATTAQAITSGSDTAMREPVAPASVAGPFGCIRAHSPATRSTTQGRSQMAVKLKQSPLRAIVLEE